MEVSTSHQILHRMVPLVCQALTTSPSDDQVWLEGLRHLSNPKLRTAMTTTSSIWLPLLLKGLDTSRSRPIIFASLKLLAEVADTVDLMKSCFIKPLKALGKYQEVSGSEELRLACARLGLVVWSELEGEEIGSPRSAVRSVPIRQHSPHDLDRFAPAPVRQQSPLFAQRSDRPSTILSSPRSQLVIFRLGLEAFGMPGAIPCFRQIMKVAPSG